LSLLDGATHRRHGAMILPILYGGALLGYFAVMRELVASQDMSVVAVPTPMPRDGLRVRVTLA
jgi:hypothetical protein